MFIFSKKRMIFINLSIVISILIYSLSSNTFSKVQLASSTPISNHTIIIDAGHGSPDERC